MTTQVLIRGFRGGLGLTGGISDVAGLVDCLCGIYDGKADIDILADYDQIRREVYWNVTDPVSSRNLERIMKTPEELLSSQDPFFAMLDKAHDPSVFDEIEKVSLGAYTSWMVD